ncbi:MAG: DMT family transporter [Rhodospirillales bacterium]|nr:DMT family transporter [Rhodospirillales bacterium]
MMARASNSRARATLLGALAILMWAALPALGAASGPVPPFQLTAMMFALAALIGLGKWTIAGQGILIHLRVPPRALALGVGGLFGYHALYFLAIQTAPPIEASLINHLWPLLIVLFSGLLPGERLRANQLAGGALGLLGALAIVTGAGFEGFKSQYLAGYLAALGCALVWSGYSVASRLFPQVPSDAVGLQCAVASALALAGHLLFETTRWPEGGQWLAVLALGLGPGGVAFYLWDHGVKHGAIGTLGVLAYFAPSLAALLLVAFGLAQFSPAILLALALIVGGAVLATRR